MGLMQKIPLIAFSTACLLYSQKLRFAHDNLYSRFSFIWVGGPMRSTKVMNNGLQLIKLIFIMMNFGSCLAGLSICGYAYGKALQNKYFRAIPLEQELLSSNLENIKVYRTYNL